MVTKKAEDGTGDLFAATALPARAPGAPRESREKVWGVYELLHAARLHLETHFGDVWVEGEILNFRRSVQGHLYFTLKDKTGQLGCVVFRSRAADVKIPLRDGVQVRAMGRLTVYEQGGRMQLSILRLEGAGEGALLLQLEELKRRLAAEGLFAAEKKRRLPMYPRHVGVVTSPTGAAIRDILNVLNRRFANLHVLLAPAKVQGEGAAREIAAAIRLLNRVGGLDVMIVGRGGGSLEDLWCFNEEEVVRAIAASRIPVISAVGHEIDTTLADYAADVRAPTPSAAAELVVKVKGEILERLGAAGRRLDMAARHRVLEARRRLERAAGVPSLASPLHAVESRAQRVDLLAMRIARAVAGLPQLARQRVDGAERRLRARMDAALDSAKARVGHAEKLLGALNPLSVLNRGYTMTLDGDGHVLKRAADAAAGAVLKTKWADGTVVSVVRNPPLDEE